MHPSNSERCGTKPRAVHRLIREHLNGNPDTVFQLPVDPADPGPLIMRAVELIEAGAELYGTPEPDPLLRISTAQLVAVALVEAALRDDNARLQQLLPTTVAESRDVLAACAGITAGLWQTVYRGREALAFDELRRHITAQTPADLTIPDDQENEQ